MMKFIEVADDDNERSVKLWRYMSLTKFIDLLSGKYLYFNNIRNLMKDDPFEGAFVEHFGKHRSEPEPTLRLDHPEGEVEALRELAYQIRYKKGREINFYHVKAALNYLYINCWHRNEDESAAMWSIYSNLNEGIAITTTLARIRSSLLDDPALYGDIYGVPVRYQRYEEVPVYKPDLVPVVSYTKRPSFQHEREYRLVFAHMLEATNVGGSIRMLRNTIDCDIPRSTSSGEHYGEQVPFEQTDWTQYENFLKAAEARSKPGYPIRFDLNELICEIWISPLAQDWVVRTVERICSDYGIPVKPKKSSLLQGPDPLY